MSLAPESGTATPITAASAQGRVWQGILLLVRLGLAAVFIFSALPKIQAPDLFASNVFNYQMLPAWGVNAMAIALPWLELVLGVCLALGLWTRASAVIVAGLMVVFIGAFVSATARGLNISCGCFEVGQDHGDSSLAWVVFRDLSFLVAALLLVRFPNAPAPLHLWRGRA
jgi:uncharacterized membrane protein YphA (DoxX/SURF4 family)